METDENKALIPYGIDPDKFPSFISDGMKKKIMENVHNLPSFIAEQAKSLNKFENAKKEADLLAIAALEKAKEVQDKKVHWYNSSKPAIELLQQASKIEGDALVSLANAMNLSFDNQKKIKEVTNFLLVLGLTNTALRRMVIRELEMRLADASEEEIDELQQEELENVLKQLKAQEDMQKRIDKQKETLDNQEKTIESLKLKVSSMENNNQDQLDKIHIEEDNRLNEIEERMAILSKSLVKEGEEFIAQGKEQISNALSVIEKEQEELSSSLKERQESAISCLQKTIEDNITMINDKSAELARSQEAFISQSKEQSSNALSLLKEEANTKVTMMKEETERYMKDYEAQFFKMKKQVKTYKILSIIAIAGTIVSVICSLL